MTLAKQYFINGPAGKLEAIYTPAPISEENDKPPVLLCHPHPLHGGTMHTKVVYWLGKIFQALGHSTLKFNFRGVACSEGQWDDGRGESDDVYSALQWLKEYTPEYADELWVAGFSFGCYAGLKAMQKEAAVSHFFAVAPAVTLYDFAFLQGDSRSIYVTHGTHDDIVPYAAVNEWVQTTAQAQLTTVPEAGHFFAKQQTALEAAILQQVDSVNPQA